MRLLISWIRYWAWALAPSRVSWGQPIYSFAGHVRVTLFCFALARAIDLAFLLVAFALAVRLVPARLTGSDKFGRVGLIIGLGLALTIALITVVVAIAAPFVQPGC